MMEIVRIYTHHKKSERDAQVLLQLEVGTHSSPSTSCTTYHTLPLLLHTFCQQYESKVARQRAATALSASTTFFFFGLLVSWCLKQHDSTSITRAEHDRFQFSCSYQLQTHKSVLHTDIYVSFKSTNNVQFSLTSTLALLYLMLLEYLGMLLFYFRNFHHSHF